MWAAGMEWRPIQPFRVLVDYNRVRYSQLKKDFIEFQGIASGRPEQLRLEDGNELHAGFEYVFLKAPLPLALRGGFWVDPDHVVRYVPTAAHDETDVLYQSFFPAEKHRCTTRSGWASRRARGSRSTARPTFRHAPNT